MNSASAWVRDEPSDPRSTRRRVFERLARSGFAINGLIHFLIGAIAVRVALGDSTGREADQSGAFQQLASTPLGRFLLWGALAGLFALALWQFIETVVLDEPRFFKRWIRRFTEAGKGVVYLGLGATALVFALGGTTSSSATVSRVTATLLSSPIGTLVLLAIGLILVGSGIGFISIGLRRSFRKLIHVPQGRGRVVVTVLGIAGYIAEGIVLGMVGVLAVYAAIDGDAGQSSGLDGALRTLGQLPLGPVVLTLVGVGLVLYGVFLVARTRLAKL